MNLIDENFLDLGDPHERTRGDERAILVHQGDARINLMEYLLEPEFVSLMDGDEEQFVVMRRFGETILQRDQINHA